MHLERSRRPARWCRSMWPASICRRTRRGNLSRGEAEAVSMGDTLLRVAPSVGLLPSSTAKGGLGLPSKSSVLSYTAP
eukprot:15447477-Alexandrium_andersonii.AAC.1